MDWLLQPFRMECVMTGLPRKFGILLAALALSAPIACSQNSTVPKRQRYAGGQRAGRRPAGDGLPESIAILAGSETHACGFHAAPKARHPGAERTGNHGGRTGAAPGV
jgi:hypothetical protein